MTNFTIVGPAQFLEEVPGCFPTQEGCEHGDAESAYAVIHGRTIWKKDLPFHAASEYCEDLDFLVFGMLVDWFANSPEGDPVPLDDFIEETLRTLGELLLLEPDADPIPEDAIGGSIERLCTGRPHGPYALLSLAGEGLGFSIQSGLIALTPRADHVLERFKQFAPSTN